MRILLINPSYFSPREAAKRFQKYKQIIKSGNMYVHPFEPPLGLAMLATFLNKKGYKAKLADMQGEYLTDEALKRILVTYKPELVGITAMTPTVHRAIKIAGISKTSLPSVPVVMGGVHPTVDPESILTTEVVDYVIRGEGECSFLNLLSNHLVPTTEMTGISWKNRDGSVIITDKSPLIKNLNILPVPDYTLFPVETYIDYTSKLRGIRAISMMISRGCPYQCSFCAVSETMGSSFRILEPEKAAQQMIDLCKKFDLEGVWFKDSIFNLNPKWTISFAKYLILQKNPYKFQINTRIDLIREKEIELLKKSGLTQIDLGIEAGTEKSLKRLNKKITLEQIRSAVKLLKQKNIDISGFFMIGIPGEDEADIQCTFDLVRDLKLNKASVSIFTPLPGSKLYQEIMSENDACRDLKFYETHHFTETKKSYCHVPLKRLKELHQIMNSYFVKR
ncbi:MAG: radical SAM protein [Desulfobacteraceae bacterium]|nr:radical SAM protein [Desulfobacteraceae bacterium]MBC2756557.1 radical SAM protein [Desulfobacteraceae bacterium]